MLLLLLLLLLSLYCDEFRRVLCCVVSRCIEPDMAVSFLQLTAANVVVAATDDATDVSLDLLLSCRDSNGNADFVPPSNTTLPPTGPVSFRRC